VGVRAPRSQDWDGHAVPDYVEAELQRFHECGIYPWKTLTLVARDGAFYASGAAIFPEQRTL